MRYHSLSRNAETDRRVDPFHVTFVSGGLYLVGYCAVFSRSVAPHIRGRLWHASQELRELSGGRLEMRMTVADTLEVRRWLLGFGAGVELLGPAELREAIFREAETLALALAPTRKPPARAAGRDRAPRRPAVPRALGRAR